MMSRTSEKPIFYRLLLAFLGVALATSSLLVTVSYVFSSDKVETHAREAVELQLAVAGRMFEATYSDHLENTLQRLVGSSVLDDYLLGSDAERLITARKLERLFKQSVREFDAITSIRFVDSRGTERVGIDGLRRARDLADLATPPQNIGSPNGRPTARHREVAARVVVELTELPPGSVFSGGPYIDASEQVAVTVGISKLDLDTGGYGGSILIRLNLDPFFNDLAELKLFGAASPIWVVSASGYTLWEPANQDLTFYPDPDLIHAHTAVAQDTVDTEVRLLSHQQGLMAIRELSIVKGQSQLRLVACLADELLQSEVQPVLRFFSIVLLVSIGLSAILAGSVARLLSSPIRRLADAALKLARGDLSARVDVDSTSSEMGLLVDSFNTMAEERFQAEALLRISERRFRSLVEQAADAMFVVDRDSGRFLEVNQQACISLGYSRAELLKLGVPDVQNDHTWEELTQSWQRMSANKPVTIEGNHRRKNGTMFPVEVRVGLFDAGDRPLLLALARDVTERQRVEQARQDAEETLEQQRTLNMRADRLRSLGEMAAGIAHELNQPLVGVRGMAEHLQIALQNGWQLDDEKLMKKAGSIVAQADRMTHIIEHVRMFARESGKPELSQLQVNDTVSAGIELLAAQLSTHGIELQTDLANDMPPVRANPYSLEEVLINLLTNARDAVDERRQSNASFYGRIIVRTSTQRNGSSDDAVCIQVTDNGPGIPEAVVSKIFDPFFTTKDPNKGTGLGLAIVFGASTDQSIQVDESRGEGVSGYYYLSAAGRGVPIVEGSERVVIQVRDRLHPELVLKEDVRYRFTDYEIDYEAGTLLFKRAVPSVSPEEHPIFIVTTYETTRSIEQRWTGGGHVEMPFRERWQLGATAVGEEREARSTYWLTAVDGRFVPRDDVSARLEVARSMAAVDGWAWKAAVHGRLTGERLRYDLQVREAGRNFDNPSSPTVRAGVRKVRGRAVWSSGTGTEVTAESHSLKDRVNDEERSSVALATRWRWRALDNRLGVDRTRSQRRSQSYHSRTVSAATQWAALPRWTLGAQRDHTFGDQDLSYRPTLTTLRSRWKLNERSDLIVEHAFRDGSPIDSSFTAAALQSKVGDDATAYANYQIDGGIAGRQNQAIVGLRHSYHPASHLSLHTAFERTWTLRQDDASNFYAYSLAAEFLPPSDIKTSGRFEQRRGRTLDKTVISGALDLAVGRDLFVLTKQVYTDEERVQGSGSGGAKAGLRAYRVANGLAYRPSRHDHLNGLARFERRYERNTLVTPAHRRWTDIGSFEFIIEPRSQIEWFARYAFKIADLTTRGLSTQTLTDLWMTNLRLEWGQNARWDVLGEYRLLTQHYAGERIHGASAECGWILTGNARVAGGYNVAGFHDGDLAGFSYWARGPYLKIQSKFGESAVASWLEGMQSAWDSW